MDGASAVWRVTQVPCAAAAPALHVPRRRCPPPAGFVLVKKVPGTLHFVARAPGHSFDYLNMNLSHLVHYLYYGNRPSPRCVPASASWPAHKGSQRKDLCRAHSAPCTACPRPG